jgi:hypothetical protein
MTQDIAKEFRTHEDLTDYMSTYSSQIMKDGEKGNAAAMRIMNLFTISVFLMINRAPFALFASCCVMCAEAIEDYEISIGIRQPKN